MKKLICLAMTLIIMAIGAVSCADIEKTNDKLTVVCTIFPQYDWVKNIVKGTDAEVLLLTDNGIDLHNFQPTARDIVDIARSDLFLYVGGTSDSWAGDVLSTTAKGVRSVAMMALVEAKSEEEIEGMEHEHGHDHEHEEYDEHVWLSIRNAKEICWKISDELCEIDKQNADIYRKNTESYVEGLRELEQKYADMADSLDKNTLIFGDRFAFRYLLDDYGFRYYAAFPGCSTDTEASFETIRFLASKVDETGAKYVMIAKGDSDSIAKTVIQTTRTKDQGILALDSLQSITKEEIESGASYIGVMEKNLAVIEKALS